jgi:hypothetical protein
MIALKTECNNELVKLLKDFILIKQKECDGIGLESNIDTRSTECNENDNVILLHQHLINQTTDPHVTKIKGALTKKRIKSAIEISKGRNVMGEITNQINVQEVNSGEVTSRSQWKCLSCGKMDHY